MPAPDEEAQVVDATRRTRLANERTYLAWLRSGFTLLALGIGLGKLGPDLADDSGWPLLAVGVGFDVVGLVFVVYGFIRYRAVERALASGGFAPLGHTAAATLTVLALLLGALGILVLLAD
jgi:putative membrane protein